MQSLPTMTSLLAFKQIFMGVLVASVVNLKKKQPVNKSATEMSSTDRSKKNMSTDGSRKQISASDKCSSVASSIFKSSHQSNFLLDCDDPSTPHNKVHPDDRTVNRQTDNPPLPADAPGILQKRTNQLPVPTT
jgi:hypothetical protein